MRILIFLLLSSAYITAMQSSKELQHIFMIPVIGYFTSFEWPTYLTDRIYFKKKASNYGLCKSEITGIVIKQPMKDVPVNTSSDIDKLYWKISEKHLAIKNILQRQDSVFFQCLGDDTEKTFKINTTAKRFDEVFIMQTEMNKLSKQIIMNDYKIGTWPRYKSYLPQQNNITLLTTKKPHVIFKDLNNNLHTIQEEKLTLPIIGMLGDLFTFVVRYHDVQLTRYNRTSRTHTILRQNPFGIRNAIRVINGLFLCWVFMKIYSKCYA